MNKASEGDEIPAELVQILKDDAVKVLHSVCQQIWKTWQWPQDWKSHSSPKDGHLPKKVQNSTHFALMSCLQGNAQILQARLQQYVNQELADVQAVFRKGRETRD